VITYPRVRMFFMLVGILATLHYTYEGIGAGLVLVADLGQWLKETFK